MAVVMVEGFDLYNGVGIGTGLEAKWTLLSGTGTASLIAGRFASGQRLLFSGTAASGKAYSRSFGAGATLVSVGFAMKISAMAASAARAAAYFMQLRSGTTEMMRLRVEPTGEIVLSRTTIQLATSAAGVVIVGQEHYIEIEVSAISDTVGAVTVYVDGVAVIAATNIDNRNGTPTTVDTIVVASVTDSGAPMSWACDDLYVLDAATKLGDQRVETVFPTSDVIQGFARSVGTSNFSLVDEAQANGDTDYVQGSTVGDVDTYGLGNLGTVPTTINAVQISAFAMKTDAGSRSVALQVVSGGTTSDGPNLTLAAGYGKLERLLTVDPNTGAAWTGAAVNALQSGPKVTV